MCVLDRADGMGMKQERILTLCSVTAQNLKKKKKTNIGSLFLSMPIPLISSVRKCVSSTGWDRQQTQIYTKHISGGASFLLSPGHFFGTTERGALTRWDGDAGGDADAVVNDGEHVDVIFHACLKARDGAGGGISWNSNL